MGDCHICGNPSPQLVCVPPMCMDCARDVYQQMKDLRTQVINNAMKHVATEADEIYRSDPTRGRGRGPKWLD